MSKGNGEMMSVRILRNDSGNPQGKLADAEVIFEAASGPLKGLRLIGFGVWERRDGGRNVTFPNREADQPQSLKRTASGSEDHLRVSELPLGAAAGGRKDRDRHHFAVAFGHDGLR